MGRTKKQEESDIKKRIIKIKYHISWLRTRVSKNPDIIFDLVNKWKAKLILNEKGLTEHSKTMKP